MLTTINRCARMTFNERGLYVSKVKDVRFVVQVFESGVVNARGKAKPLRLIFKFDPVTGKIVQVSKNAKLPETFTSYKINRRQYYEWGNKFLPRKPMTEEERKKAHVLAQKRYRQKHKNKNHA